MIGVILKELRAEKHITQVALATTLHVKQSTISSWEIERTSPTLEQLGDLANIFEVSCDYLIGRTTSNSLSGELTQSYKRRIRFQSADYSLKDCLNVITPMVEESKLDKEKLVVLLDHMTPTDFKEFCNVIAAVIETKE